MFKSSVDSMFFSAAKEEHRVMMSSYNKDDMSLTG